MFNNIFGRLLLMFPLLFACSAKNFPPQQYSDNDNNTNTNTNNNNAVLAACSPVVSFGRNSFDAVGTNSGVVTNSLTPVNVQDLTAVSIVSAGRYHGLALKSDGTVWVWGNGGNGQLGDGTFGLSSKPKMVVALTGVTSVSAGSEHNLALKSDGTVWAWGANGFGEDRYGQVGNGSTEDQATPVQVLSGVIEIAAGRYHSAALKSDGTVWVWGRNEHGQVGDNTLIHKFVPTQVVGVGGVGNLSDIVNIYAGGYHVVAVKNDGSLWTWGYNAMGQLGDNTTVSKKVPIQVLGLGGVGVLSDVSSVYLGRYHSMFLKNDGSLLVTGQDLYGQLGVSTTTNQKVLQQVLGVDGVGFLSDIAFISGGQYFSYAIDVTGNVFAWGDNTDGQLGDGTIVQRNTPVQLSGFSQVTFIEGGDSHGLMLADDHTIKSWGDGLYGELGSGPISISEPSFVAGLDRDEVITDVSGGLYNLVVLKGDGTVWSLGMGLYGQLGDNTTTNRTTLVKALGVDGVGFITDIKAVSTGSYFTVALKNDGTVFAWGYNLTGQLGDGTLVDKATPVQVLGLTDVTSVSTGGVHSLALKSDGTVWAWGNNVKGQLGNNTIVNSSTPVQVMDAAGTGYLTDIIVVAAGTNTSFALKSDGTLWAWGGNLYGQVGDNTLVDKKLPVQVVGEGAIGFLENVIAIATSGQHALAQKIDGSIWSWGLNTSGQLGDGTITNSSAPIRILGPDGVGFMSNVVKMSAGSTHSLFLTADGSLYGNGLNQYGQLGGFNYGLFNVNPTAISGVNNNITKIFGGRSRTTLIVDCNP